MKAVYSEPKLKKYTDSKKEWYVHFRFNGKLKIYKMGLNREKNLKVREREFKDLITALKQRLAKGWNPFVNSFEYQISIMSICEAIDFSLAKKKEYLKPRTYDSYKTCAKQFNNATHEIHLHYLDIKDVKRMHIKLILEKVKDLNGWSNVTFNKNLGYICALFTEMLQWDIIENSPATKIRKLPELKKEANRPATDAEMEIIKKHLEHYFPNLLVFAAAIFHTGIRPEELMNVKIGNIDFKNDIITLDAENTKTKMERRVPINKYLKAMLLSSFDFNVPEGYYLFGSIRESMNRGANSNTDLLPGPRNLQRSFASKLWNKLVKEELGINVNMYSMKHLGANKKILAGMDLDSLRQLFGHTSKLMTMHYAKEISEVYKKDIMDNSPDF